MEKTVKKIADYLLTKVADIPYYIQFIASEIWQTLMLDERKIVSKKDVDEAAERILILNADYYWELTNRQTAYRKKVLFALSNAVSGLFSKNTAEKYGLGASSSTQKALETFLDDGIIEHITGKYEFSDPFYKIFVQRHL